MQGYLRPAFFVSTPFLDSFGAALIYFPASTSGDRREHTQKSTPDSTFTNSPPPTPYSKRHGLAMARLKAVQGSAYSLPQSLRPAASHEVRKLVTVPGNEIVDVQNYRD